LTVARLLHVHDLAAAAIGDAGLRSCSADRPSGWNTWLTFAISEAAPASTVTPTRHMATK
jgi:hypothetical protein